MIEKAIADFDQKRDELKRYGPIQRYGKPRNQDDKKAAESLARALRHVERVLERDDVRRLTRVGPLCGVRINFSDWENKLGQFCERLDDYATWPLGAPHPHKPKSPIKREAVRAAAALLEAHGKRLSKTPFCSAASAIYDDPNLPPEHFEPNLPPEHFEHYCKQFLVRRRPHLSE